MKRSFGLTLLSIVLIACGSPTADKQNSIEKDNPFPVDVAAATLDASSARTFTHQTMTFDESAGGGELVMKSVGLVDFESQLQTMTMTADGEGQAGVMADQIGTIEMVGEGLVFYMKSPMFQFPGVKPWVKMDMQAMGEEMGMDFGSLMQMSQGDASASLDYLEGLDDVEVVGEEEVHGKATTHYTGTGTFEKMKEVLSEDAAKTIDQLMDLTGLKSFDIEVWIDTQDRARRMELRYDGLPMPTSEGQMDMVIEFYDFGVDVEVDIPPPHKVTDILEMTDGNF